MLLIILEILPPHRKIGIMPRIQIGEDLIEVIDCPSCGRTVLAENRPATGWLTNCGRRLVNLAECRLEDCSPSVPRSGQHTLRLIEND